MLALYLLRHAKSSWGDAGLEDRERPLNRRGREAAPRIGREMRRLGLIPKLVLCSTAERARQTLALVLPAFDPAPTIEYDDALYLAEPSDMLARLAETSQSPVLLVGHNPGIGDLAVALAGDGSRQDMERLTQRYPTGSLTVLHFPLERWADVAAGQGRLICHIRPRDLQVQD